MPALFDATPLPRSQDNPSNLIAILMFLGVLLFFAVGCVFCKKSSERDVLIRKYSSENSDDSKEPLVEELEGRLNQMVTPAKGAKLLTYGGWGLLREKIQKGEQLAREEMDREMLDFCDQFDNTLLHYAAKNGYEENIWLLIDCGTELGSPSINARDSGGYLPEDYVRNDDEIKAEMKAWGKRLELQKRIELWGASIPKIAL